MNLVKLTIDDTSVTAEEEKTILQAALEKDIYIPALCSHPELPVIENMKGAPFVFRGNEKIESENPDAAWDGCGICAVEVNGEIVRACATKVADGMKVDTKSNKVLAYRQEKLAAFLTAHPHACLTCAQAEGCPRTQCSSNVPEIERCCELLGACELQRISQFVGVPMNLPKYKPRGFPVFTGEPLFNFNTELCIGCLRCVRACRELRGVGTLSFVFKEGRPLVGTTASATRAESHCRFCGACVEVCPTGALMDKVRAVGAERIKTLIPCRNACPAGINIPQFVRYIARGKGAQAIAVIREKVPLAFAAGYVCFHPCEEECRRGEVNKPVSICRLKRFAAGEDDFAWRSRRKKLPASGKKAAVIGSGPAGLTAAYYLAKKGHETTIFEALPKPGGMLRVGIPEYRFPAALLDRDIEEIKSVGVEIKCDAQITAADLEKLEAEFDAVFVAAGAHNAKKIKLPGSDLPGVLWGVEFLRESALGKHAADIFKGKKVTVVGGGNVAVDSARVALRMGAADISVVSLEKEDELPAYEWEISEAREEGISFLTGWGPMEITGKEGGIASLKCKRCTRVFDEAGRFAPTYDEKETNEIPTAAVILSIGQEPSSEPFAALGLRGNRTIDVDKERLAAKKGKFFAGGDIVSGPASVIEAIAAGRKAAIEIDRLLGGDGDIDEELVEREPLNHYLGQVENFAKLDRSQPAIRDISERKVSFCAVEETFTKETAAAEALRCLACDLRLEIEKVIFPPHVESLFELAAEAIAGLPAEEGVYRLLDKEKKIIAIKGVMNLKDALFEVLENNKKASFFIYEKEPMFTKRESELIQQYLQEHGELPGGGDDDLDDLF